VAVPKQKLHVNAADDPIPQSKETQAAEAAEMRKLTDKLHKEAEAGVDFDKLEEQAYKAALDPSTPGTELGTRFDDMVPPEDRKMIFGMEEGQITPVIEDSHEYLFFKIRNKHMLPLADARHWYGQLIMRDMRKALAASVNVEYNDQYFPQAKPKSAGDESVGAATAH
jgi:hypothetical protein